MSFPSSKLSKPWPSSPWTSTRRSPQKRFANLRTLHFPRFTRPPSTHPPSIRITSSFAGLPRSSAVFFCDFSSQAFPELHFARDNKGQLLRQLHEAELKKEIVLAAVDEDDKKLEKLKPKAKKAADAHAATKAADVQEEEKQIFRAFLSCRRAEDCEILLEEYRFSTFVIGRFLQGRKKRFQGKRITVSRAPDPSNILWENQDCRTKERNRDSLFPLSVIIIIIIIIIHPNWGISSPRRCVEVSEQRS